MQPRVHSKCVAFPSYPPFHPPGVRGFILARHPRRYTIALASVFEAQLVARARCVIVRVAVAVELLAWQGARAHEARDADAGRPTHAVVARNPTGPGRLEPTEYC
jgi:hypothetical protein